MAANPVEFLDADSLRAIAAGRCYDRRELDGLLERAAGRGDAHRSPFLAAEFESGANR